MKEKFVQGWFHQVKVPGVKSTAPGNVKVWARHTRYGVHYKPNQMVRAYVAVSKRDGVTALRRLPHHADRTQRLWSAVRRSWHRLSDCERLVLIEETREIKELFHEYKLMIRRHGLSRSSGLFDVHGCEIGG